MPEPRVYELCVVCETEHVSPFGRPPLRLLRQIPLIGERQKPAETAEPQLSSQTLNASTGIACRRDFEWVTLAMTPMIHFSATFLPIGVHPRGPRIFVEHTPHYQGMEIIRGLMPGTVEFALIGRAAYLAVISLAGPTLALRHLGNLLLF